jgi:hypothetical protein
MASTPTPRADLYRWHTNALLGVYGDPDVACTEEPQCGWFKRRLVKGGPYVPARIWMFQWADDESGDLVADEVLQCEVDGERADVNDQWPWLMSIPIAEHEFRYMEAVRLHCQVFEPCDPISNPRQKTDWLTVPLPTF